MSSDAFEVAQLALLGEAAECLEDVAVFVWDDDRRYVAVNDWACELLGLTRQEVLALHVGDLSDNRASPLFEDVQQRGVHTGRLETPGGEVEFMTCRTRVAGLPYMVSICWRPGTA
jgi:PAS domain-containing protein